jgi:hypothetical protein
LRRQFGRADGLVLRRRGLAQDLRPILRRGIAGIRAGQGRLLAVELDGAMAIAPGGMSQGAMTRDMTVDAFLEPGVLVRHPGRPDWGVGQVQSVNAPRITVTFAEAGKQVIDAREVRLTYEGPDPRLDGRGA